MCAAVWVFERKPLWSGEFSREALLLSQPSGCVRPLFLLFVALWCIFFISFFLIQPHWIFLSLSERCTYFVFQRQKLVNGADALYNSLPTRVKICRNALFKIHFFFFFFLKLGKLIIPNSVLFGRTEMIVIASALTASVEMRFR